MAWNPSPEVAMARTMAGKLGADQIVCLFIKPSGQIGYVSYGATRELCSQTKLLADVLFDAAHHYYEGE